MYCTVGLTIFVGEVWRDRERRLASCLKKMMQHVLAPEAPRFAKGLGEAFLLFALE